MCISMLLAVPSFSNLKKKNFNLQSFPNFLLGPGPLHYFRRLLNYFIIKQTPHLKKNQMILSHHEIFFQFDNVVFRRLRRQQKFVLYLRNHFQKYQSMNPSMVYCRNIKPRFNRMFLCNCNLQS